MDELCYSRCRSQAGTLTRIHYLEEIMAEEKKEPWLNYLALTAAECIGGALAVISIPVQIVGYR